MWQPEAAWHPLPGGGGPSTVGVWRTVLGEQSVAVKRLAAPLEDDPAELLLPHHFAYWRRAADVLARGLVDATPGLRAPGPTAIDEDVEGITLTQPWVEDAANSGLFAARSMGRFAAAELDAPALATDQLRDRMSRVDRRGGWTTLARTAVADVADRLWRRRHRLLDELDRLPQVAQHGDPTPANFPGAEDGDIIAIDWGCLGHGPVGGDVGYFSLSAREELDPLLEAYLLGLPDGLATAKQILHSARMTAVLTALNRADWALARVAVGEGALAGKFRHPAVAPHLRGLQRLYGHVEALL